MKDDLNIQAAKVRMTIARSGRHYLLADRWGSSLMVSGSPLLTREQVRELIAEETKRLHRLTMEFCRP